MGPYEISDFHFKIAFHRLCRPSYSCPIVQEFKFTFPANPLHILRRSKTRTTSLLPGHMLPRIGPDAEYVTARGFRESPISAVMADPLGRWREGRHVKIILAQPRGFCAGVVRAIDIVERALAKYGAPVYVRHEIVHNRHVVESLKAKGVRFVEDLDEVPEGAVTIFSAHGVSRKVENEAKLRSLPIIDATCPLVTKVHIQGRRYIAQGRIVVFIGHAGHPEVEGTLGQIDGELHLVGNEEDVEKLPIDADTPIAYVTQTTLSVDDTRGVIAALHRRFSDVAGPEIRDICYATQNRQNAVRELSRVADVLIVVGARNSSNSNRLREIGEDAGLPSYLVADSGEIDAEWVRNAGAVGVTAGASAPEVVVEDVVRTLMRIGPSELSTLDGPTETVSFRLPTELMS